MRRAGKASRRRRCAIRDRIEQGQPLKGTLDEVVLLIESQLDWALGVVMRVRAGVLELAAGDRVPPLLAGTLRSVAVDPSGAPCSCAAARNEPVVLTDVSASPAPARLPGLSAAGVRAWCSWPVSDPSGYVVATVDALRTRPVPLLPSEQDAMVTAAELVAAAMEASRRSRARAARRPPRGHGATRDRSPRGPSPARRHGHGRRARADRAATASPWPLGVDQPARRELGDECLDRVDRGEARVVATHVREADVS